MEILCTASMVSERNEVDAAYRVPQQRAYEKCVLHQQLTQRDPV